MGTTVHVQPEHAADTVQKVFERVDLEMSEWKEDSPLSNINRKAGISKVKCPEELVDAIQIALDISNLTSGSYDPTWACMWELWDFKNPTLPSKQEINVRLPLMNWEKVKIEGNTVFLQEEGMMLGLGSIAKGVALNQARDVLLSKQIENFMLVVGGQVMVNGSPRIVGIRKPDGLANEFIAKVEITNTSISTSGDYEKYFELNGVRYHHIIDPQTGYPARGTKSVTVVSTDAALADALSTGLFVMGAERAIVLVNTLPGVETFIIDSEGNQFMSSCMHELIVQ